MVSDQKYLLIDLSSYIFYRNFALCKWKQAAGIDSSTFSDDDFLQKYSSIFKSKLLGYQKKLKVPFENIILAKDCPRVNIWRNEIFPEYKGNRQKCVANLDPLIFTQTYTEILPELISKYGIHVIEHDCAESDDIIAVICQTIQRNEVNSKVTILSLDTDFLQLLNPNIDILDFNLKSISEKAQIQKVLDIYLLWKIIQGDKSDNIPAIAERIGAVSAESLARNPIVLEKKLQDEITKKNYERNKTLISFECIPCHICDNINEKYLTLKRKFEPI
jgi:5'-3' exonuclease